jgi:hypothetical protein
MKRSGIVATILILASLVLPVRALAANERVTFQKDTDGSIIATVSGLRPPCSFEFLQSSVAVAGFSVSIVTDTAEALCPVPFPPSPPSPYSFSVNLGRLSDGTYSVGWSFRAPFLVGSPPIQPLTSSLVIQNAAVIDPFAVPALTLPGYVLLFALIIVFQRTRIKTRRDHAV